MEALAAAAAVLLIFGILWDGFETVVLPRRVSRRIRLTSLFYRSTWSPWASLARRIPNEDRREGFLAYYGPLAILLLLVVWAGSLVVGFAVLQWALGSGIREPEGVPTFVSDLYYSGTTFFTLGLGDVVPTTAVARAITVVEAGLGFGFLAMVVGYFPVIYQAFSRRESNISLLDARAGSPPSAVELLRRHPRETGLQGSIQFLRDWERWSAELLESHLSYPFLAYFRSQHDNQSWLASLTVVLDVCSLVIAGMDEVPSGQAQLTFAIARHAAVDLAQVFGTPPRQPGPDRLSSTEMARMRRILAEEGVQLHTGEMADRELAELRHQYEPYVCALSEHLVMPLPPWIPSAEILDAWQTSAWDHGGSVTGGPGPRRSPMPIERLERERRRRRR